MLIACEEKAKPRVTINSDLERPISCIKLNKLVKDKDLLSSLEKLYTFDDSCALTLTLSSKGMSPNPKKVVNTFTP